MKCVFARYGTNPETGKLVYWYDRYNGNEENRRTLIEDIKTHLRQFKDVRDHELHSQDKGDRSH